MKTGSKKPKIVSVCLGQQQMIELDRLALSLKEKTGRGCSRSEIIRALIDDLLEDPKALERLKKIGPRTHAEPF